VLLDMAKELYREHYWAPISGDKIPSQKIANELFESTVNMPRLVVITALQRALNVLCAKTSDKLLLDGQYGPKTAARVREAIHRDGDAGVLLKLLNSAQCMYYMHLAQRTPNHRRFLRGWIGKRVNFA